MVMICKLKTKAEIFGVVSGKISPTVALALLFVELQRKMAGKAIKPMSVA